MLKINPQLVTTPFDDGSANQTILCELLDQHGRPQHVLVTTKLLQLLGRLDGNTTIDRFLDEQQNSGLSPEAIPSLRRSIAELVSKRVLVEAESITVAAPANRPHYLQFKQKLLPPSLTRRCVIPFRPLFTNRAVPLVLLAAVAGEIAYFLALKSTAQSTIPVDSLTLIAGVALAAAGLIVHELGHATAADKFACRNVEIGFGWYICFPVFYADLSEIWRLPRHQRAIVDAGGLWLQALFIAVLMLAYQYLPSPAFLYAATLLNVSLLWNLNPFFRMDGYWLASDLLGVPNLRTEATALIGRWLPSRFRRHRPAVQRPDWRLVTYAVLSSLFLLGFLYVLATSSLPTTLSTLPAHYAEALQMSSASWPDRFVALCALIWNLLVLYGLGRILLTNATRAGRWAQRSLIGRGEQAS